MIGSTRTQLVDQRNLEIVLLKERRDLRKKPQENTMMTIMIRETKRSLAEIEVPKE